MKRMIILFVGVAFYGASNNAMQPQSDDIFNNPKLMYHALGPKFYLPGLEGIDPSVSITATESGLKDYLEKNPDMSVSMKSRIANMQKSLARAKTNYLICIGLVKLTDEPESVQKMALKLAQDANNLSIDASCPSLLFVGGHYLYTKGSLGGHTASYDVARQEDGKLCFTVINTLKAENDASDGDLLHEDVYSDLDTTDLDADFWKNVITLNYMNSVKGKFFMEAFYLYLDKKLNKGSNKRAGRSFHRQIKGVCGWKALSVWTHGKIAPCNHILERTADDERAYMSYKKGILERMHACFIPEKALDIKSAQILKDELEKKLAKVSECHAFLQ